MYVVFYGDDRGLIRDEASNFIKGKLNPGQSFNAIEAADFEPGQINDAVGSSSLFGASEWYLLDEPSANAEFLTEVTASLEAMKNSTNNFVIIEGKLLVAPKKKYEKFADKTKEFTADKKVKANPFLMAEALSQKDKKKLWVLLQEAKMSGMREEEIIGILWWQLKTLRLASVTRSASEAGLKDFPYNKAKRSLSTFRPGEISKLSQSILKVYHDGHGGVRDMEVALEEWVLSL
jgi:DNA polymerase III delta subunit